MSKTGSRPPPPTPAMAAPGTPPPPPPPPIGSSNGSYSATDEKSYAALPGSDRVVIKPRVSDKGAKHLRDSKSVLRLLHPLMIAPLLLLALALGIVIGRAGTGNVEASGASPERLADLFDVMEVLLAETSGNEKALQEIREKLANRGTSDRGRIGAKRQDKPKDSKGARRPGLRARVEDASGRASRSKVIASFEGDRPRSVPPFTARKPWRVVWSGDDVFFFIRAEDGRLIHGDGGSGRGSYVVRRSGRFYLEVIASADWTLKVERALR
jgi:hypothetical protein